MKIWKQLTQRHSRLLRLGCAALSLMLMLGAVPFLAGYADGDTVTCTADPDTGVVTITGNQSNTILKKEMIEDTAAWTAEEIIIGDNITSVYTLAFEANWAIKKITVNSNVVKLYENAFEHCDALEKITIHCNGTLIYANVFSNSAQLTDVYLDGSSIRLQQNRGTFNSSNTGVTVHVACHLKEYGDYIESDSTLFDPATIDSYSIKTQNQADPTCTEKGYTGDKECTKCGETIEAGEDIDALGHEWESAENDGWVVIREATETEDGLKKRVCKRTGCGFEEEDVIPKTGSTSSDDPGEDPGTQDSYEFTSDSVFKWTMGSKKGMTVIVKNTNADRDSETFTKFDENGGKVLVGDKELAKGTDYKATNGCVKIELQPDYLKKQKAGKYTLKVVIDGKELTHQFTIAQSGGTDSPATGESIALVVCCAVMMVLAVGGVVFVLLRRRKASE